MTIARVIRRLASNLPVLANRLGHSGAIAFEHICIAKLCSRISSGPPARPSSDFMNFILKDRLATTSNSSTNPSPKDPMDSLLADTMMIMNAGSDTTAAALSSTLWFLLRHPKALSRLRNELISATGHTSTSHLSARDSILPYSTVKSLPYLRACIDESLRLRPPIAYQLPRLVTQPTRIAGYEILPGTVVAVAPYSVHRHPSLFPDPDAYEPGRWVDLDENFPNHRQNLKMYNIVFSQGSRACIGRHLAIFELQVLVSTLVMRYVYPFLDDLVRDFGLLTGVQV
jgi:benzoate 4-monooxygenase